jgi:hypothetical protein
MSWATSASLGDSAQCECRYCNALCENKPEWANSDWVEVHLLKTSLRATYCQHYPRGIRKEIKDFIGVSSKFTGTEVDSFLGSAAQEDPIIPMLIWASGNTGSEQGLETIRSWLDKCLTTHKSFCLAPHGEDGTSELPDRVIEVNFDTPRLIRLMDTGDEKGRYACLSHCWGGQQPLQTTRKPDTLSTHQQNTQYETLPKTFQDAMKIITKLRIKYIWIDSSCVRYFDLCSTEHLFTLLFTDHPKR